MTRILFALTLACLATDASAQSRQYYDSSGRSVGRSSTDSQGSTTFYDASGRVTGRSSTSGNTTTIYDERGRSFGRATTNR
jgi:YD repeat-containing protein